MIRSGVARALTATQRDYVLSAPHTPADAPTEAAKHIGGRANAEDCPACDTRTMPFPWICPGEDTQADAHGRTWDPHPFVQSRAVDNVSVCICGQSPDRRIHGPETTPDAPKGGED